MCHRFLKNVEGVAIVSNSDLSNNNNDNNNKMGPKQRQKQGQTQSNYVIA